MKMLVHMHRPLSAESDFIGLLACLCERADTVIVLEGAAIFCIETLVDALKHLNAHFRICIEDEGGMLPLKGRADSIGKEELSAMIAGTDLLLSF